MSAKIELPPISGGDNKGPDVKGVKVTNQVSDESTKVQAVIKQANIIYPVFEHGRALNTHSKSKACIFFTIDITVFQYGRIHHSASENFYPAGMLTNRASISLAYQTRNNET